MGRYIDFVITFATHRNIALGARKVILDRRKILKVAVLCPR